MKVLYDHQAFQMQYFGGVSRCFCELIKRLPDDVRYEISITQSDNVHLHESNLVPDLQSVTMDHAKWNNLHSGRIMDFLYLAANKILPLHTAESLNRRATYQALTKQNFDVFHATYYKPEFLSRLGKKPFVITLHDMMPELYPQYYSQNSIEVKGKRELANRADAIIAVSENTKQDAIRILGLSPERITVIHHGGPSIEYIADDPIVSGRYFLYVGQRIFYKNFPQTLRSFASAFKDDPTIRLVCTGHPFSALELELIKELNVEKSVIHLHPSDAEMKNLYANAIAFIYPSEYEGFGMPILEAYAYGCPVILNYASCFPEVAGEAATYCHFSEDGTDLSEVLRDVSHWTKEKRELEIAKGYERLRLYSWEESANKLSDVYRSLL